jgi:hypothetical protein
MLNKANLMIYQGDDYQGTVTVSDGTGTPPDLSGYSAQAQIRDGPADSNPAVVCQIEAAITSPYVNLTIPKTDTVLLTKQSYCWDLQLTAGDGTITTILAGQVFVTLEVTRP